jgi:hypothetical protein
MDGMGGLSIGGVLLALLVVALWVYPVWRIIDRTGRHPALSLFAIVPPLGLILLWWLAFTDWPAQRDKGRAN